MTQNEGETEKTDRKTQKDRQQTGRDRKKDTDGHRTDKVTGRKRQRDKRQESERYGETDGGAEREAEKQGKHTHERKIIEKHSNIKYIPRTRQQGKERKFITLHTHTHHQERQIEREIKKLIWRDIYTVRLIVYSTEREIN